MAASSRTGSEAPSDYDLDLALEYEPVSRPIIVQAALETDGLEDGDGEDISEEEDEGEEDAEAELAEDWASDGISVDEDAFEAIDNDNDNLGVTIKVEHEHEHDVGIRQLEVEEPDDGQDHKRLLEAKRDRAGSATSTGLRKSTGKRKLAQDSPGSTPGPSNDSTTVAIAPLLVPASAPGFFAVRNHPCNKPAYRYMPCGPSPGLKSSIPTMCRIIESPPAGSVRFSWEDRSLYVNMSKDARSITTEKGFRGARANVPLREGTWYFEFMIEKSDGSKPAGGKDDAFGPHVRIGIARREAHLNAPVGYDAYSYGLRDKGGDKLHISQPKPYGKSFGMGDVIGVYVHLPPRSSPPIPADSPTYQDDELNPARIVLKRYPLRYKGQLYFEMSEYAPSKEMEDLAFRTRDPIGFAKAAAEAAHKKAAPPPGKKKAPPPPEALPPRPLPTLPGSKLAFFKNGEYQGVAFENLLDWLPLRQHPKVAGQPTHKLSIAATLLLAKERHHDDGSLGYYPAASVFGGGIVRLNPGPDFQFPPPANVEQLLNRNKSATNGAVPRPEAEPRSWRPLCDRYAEYYDELRRYDEIEECNALKRADNGPPPNADTALSEEKPVSGSSFSTPFVVNGSQKGSRSSGRATPVNHAKRKTALSQQISREVSPADSVTAGVDIVGSVSNAGTPAPHSDLASEDQQEAIAEQPDLAPAANGHDISIVKMEVD